MANDVVTEVLMPLMGEGITEATLVKWLKKPGEPVKKEEPLLEVSTDKVDTEIPAPAGGVLVDVFAKDGETVAINAVIAHIAAEGAAKAGASAAPAKTTMPAVERPSASKSAGSGADVAGEVDRTPVTSTTTTTNTTTATSAGASASARDHGEGRKSSPLVRKMARSMKVDLRYVEGTGLGGRITKKDLEAFAAGGGMSGVARGGESAGAAARAVPAGAPVAKGQTHLEHGRLETRSVDGKEVLEGVPVRREKMSKMRALIAEHMVRSVRTSPHVTTVFEIDMHKVVKAREKHKKAFQAKEGFGLTFTAFFTWAAVQAIKAHPIVNVSVDGEDILWKDQINVGVAVAIETGLIVPVIKNAGELNLLGVARRLNDLAARARSKKLTPEDVQGGTFSITNPGMFGSIVSNPIINQPQVAILSIGAVVKRPVVIDDAIGIRPLVQVGLTFDHRVVDGEGGARWLATFKETLESFDESVI